MRTSAVILLPFLATSAIAQTIELYDDDKCEDPSVNYDIDNYIFLCEKECTNVELTDAKSLRVGVLEYNQQLVLYEGKDCQGDPYTAAGRGFGSAVTDMTCIVSPCDGFGSFKTNIYNTTGGGEACPPGSLTEAPTLYPSPTGSDCS